jgi:hypothetical protein
MSRSRIEDFAGANAEEFGSRYGGHIYFSDLLLFFVLYFLYELGK